MILIPGKTQCPLCGKLVYETDDLFVVRQLDGVEKLPDCNPGIYHHDCFRSAAFRAAYLELAGQACRQQILANARENPLLGMDDSFALVWNPFTEKYTLYFLKQGRELKLAGRSGLEEFRELIADPARAWSRPPRPAGPQLLSAPDGWTVAVRRSCLLRYEFAQADFAKLLKQLGVGAETLTGQSLDLGAVCGQLRITPLSASGPLPRALGVVREVEVLASRKKALVTLEVEKTERIPLTAHACVDLRRLLEQAPQK
jgi:hypothetical protein